MKKVVCAAAILAVAGMGFAKVNEKLYKKNIIKSEPCERQTVWLSENIYKYRGEITYQQMKEDLASLKYILETCYSGYEKACERGMNLDDVIARLEERFADQETVYSRDLAKAFYEETKKYIIDGHFVNYLGTINSSLRFCDHENIYYSDLFIEKDEADSFSSEEGALFPYFKNGKEMLRVGRFSVEPVIDVSFKLNGKQQKLPVKLYTSNTPSYKPIYVEKETPQTAYIRLESFMPNGSKASEINLNKFSTAGQRFLNKSNVIVDLRANNGGLPEYEDNFVKSFLFDTKKIDSEEVKYQIENTFFLKRVELSEGCYKLISPGIVQLEEISYERDKKNKKLYKDYVSHWDKIDVEIYKMCLSWMKTPSKIYTKTHFVDKNIKALPFPEKPAFKGKMFILVDRNSTSAPEEFVMLAKKCFGEDSVTIVGESSYGNIEFGNLLDYSLPNSELTFHVASDTVAPAMEKLSNWHGEGKGIYPDVWSTDEDMLETLVAVTGDEALREVLKGMK